MRNFALGVIVGLLLAICGYRPYQIESEYRRNIANGLGTPIPAHCGISTITVKHI